MYSTIQVGCLHQLLILGEEQNDADPRYKEVIEGPRICALISVTPTKNQSTQVHTMFLVLFVIQVAQRSSNLIFNHPNFTSTGGHVQLSIYQAMNDDALDHTSNRLTFEVPTETPAIEICQEVVQCQS